MRAEVGLLILSVRGRYLTSMIIIRIYSPSPTAAHPPIFPVPEPLHACMSRVPVATMADHELVSSRCTAGSGKSTSMPHAPERLCGLT